MRGVSPHPNSIECLAFGWRCRIAWEPPSEWGACLLLCRYLFANSADLLVLFVESEASYKKVIKPRLSREHTSDGTHMRIIRTFAPLFIESNNSVNGGRVGITPALGLADLVWVATLLFTE